MELKDLLLIISALVNIYALYNLRIVEREKSKLKKTEMLFDLRAVAVKKFNEIYQKHNPSNCGELFYTDIYSRKDLEELRKDIAQYRAEHGYVFDGDEIDKMLEEAAATLSGAIDEYIQYESYMEDKGLTHEEAGYYPRYYKDTVKLISKANKIMRKYLFDEAKR